MKIALLQAQSQSRDYATNLDRLDHFAQQAKAQGAALLITPEMFLSGYVLYQDTVNMAQQFPLAELQALARRHAIALIVGGPRQVEQGVMNSSYFIDDQGCLLNHYDKTHLFGELDREQFLQGEQGVVLSSYRGFKIAMLICYDVEFPETVRAAALAGADLIAVPTAQMQPYDVVNTHLIATRAWENQVYVAYANQIGIEGQFAYVGMSTIASPDGKILVQGTTAQEQLLYADISTAKVQQSQHNNPYLKDIRQDLF